MSHVKYDTSHHAGATPEARIASRLRNSGGEEADHIVQKGSGPTRTFTNIHHPGTPTAPIIIKQGRVDPPLLILCSHRPGRGHCLFVELGIVGEVGIGRPHDLTMWHRPSNAISAQLLDHSLASCDTSQHFDCHATDVLKGL